MKITVGKKNITYIWDNFQNWFGDMNCRGKKLPLYFKTLEKPMNDKEIFDELKPTECTLADLYNSLNDNRMLKNGYANIFYIKDNKGILRAVRAYWGSDGWYLDASAVDHPYRWRGGHHVVSRKLTLSPSESDPLTLGHSDPSDLESRVKEILKELEEVIGKIIKNPNF
jgi:hypothetical protein